MCIFHHLGCADPPVVTKDVLKDIMNERLPKDGIDPHMMTQTFVPKLTSAITASAADSEVAGFKSIACYRTGLDITVNQEWVDLERCFIAIALRYESLKTLRLADKALNDLVVCITLRIAGQYGKPGN